MPRPASPRGGGEREDAHHQTPQRRLQHPVDPEGTEEEVPQAVEDLDVEVADQGAEDPEQGVRHQLGGQHDLDWSLALSRNVVARKDPNPEPIWAMGPSFPAEP